MIWHTRVVVSTVLAAVGDPGASRLVLLIVIVLVALGLGLAALAVWLWRVTAPEPVALAVLEVMGERRFASADEVAGVVTWLAGDDAAYISGAVIPVDGGLGMGH